jgi:hypothetical protein
MVLNQKRWMLSRMLPRRYGDRGAIEVTGKDGKPLFEDRPTDKLATGRWIALILTQADQDLKDKAEGGIRPYAIDD